MKEFKLATIIFLVILALCLACYLIYSQALLIADIDGDTIAYQKGFSEAREKEAKTIKNMLDECRRRGVIIYE